MPSFSHAPLSRHPALVPLSRDHYVGLVQAHRLMKAAAADDAQRRHALAEFADAWERELVEHFRDEERLLGALMSAEDRARLVGEHARLAELAQQARAARREVAPDATALHALGETLEGHIRWEERELFPRLQRQLNETQLTELQRHTAELEAARPRNTSR